MVTDAKHLSFSIMILYDFFPFFFFESIHITIYGGRTTLTTTTKKLVIFMEAKQAYIYKTNAACFIPE